MSKIAKPESARFGNTKGVVSLQIWVLVDQLNTPPLALAEFIEFLELVYEVRLRQINEKDGHVWLIVPRKDRTEAGVKVASWLCGVNYTLPNHHATYSYDV